MTINDYEDDNKVIVSNRFVEIYRNFNVLSQSESMKLLSRKELYLLLLLCMDKHSEEDPVCINNYKEFSSEITEIYDVQDDRPVINQDISDLIRETGDNYIDINNIVDMLGLPLPEPLEKSMVRDAKIDNLLDDSK